MTLDLDSIVLDSGAHDPNSGAGCVMEWASVLAGEEWSDNPRCTSQVIAAFLRSWNDSLGDVKRQQLKRYIPLVIGTNRGPEMDQRLAWMVTDWFVRVQAPAWLRLAGLTEQAEVLEGLPEVTSVTVPSIKGPLETVRKDAAVAWAAAWDATSADAWDAARDAAWAAARAAARGAARAAARGAARAAAARGAARAAAWDVAMDAAWDAAWDAARAAAARDAAWAARDAAWAVLDPTKRDLQAKAHDLLDRMIAVASAPSLRDRIAELAIIWDRESIEPAEDFANAVMGLLADADPTDLGLETSGVWFCRRHSGIANEDEHRGLCPWWDHADHCDAEHDEGLDDGACSPCRWVELLIPPAWTRRQVR